MIPHMSIFFRNFAIINYYNNQHSTTMKKVLLFAIAASVLLCGCLRDEDKDMLRNPIHVTGTVDPTFGFSVASTHMDIEKVLSLLDGAEQYIDQTNTDDFITLKFDTVFSNEFPIDATKAKRASRSKTGGFTYTKEFSGEQSFSVFNEMDILKKLKMTDFFVNWTADFYAVASDQLQTLARNHDITVELSDIKLVATGYNNDTEEIIVNNGEAIDINDMLSGDTLKGVRILTDQDIAQLAALAPQKVKYQAKVTFSTSELIFVSPERFMIDSLTITEIDIKSRVGCRFPVNVSLEYLSHNIDTVDFDLGHSLDSIIDDMEQNPNIDVSLKSVTANLVIDNSLPFTAKLHTVIMDENYTPLMILIDSSDNAQNVLTGAPVVPSPSNPNIYISNGSSRSKLSITIDADRLNILRQAKHVSFAVAAFTSMVNGQYPFVAPRRTDGIDIKMYIQLNPNIHFDYPLIINDGKEGE